MTNFFGTLVARNFEKTIQVMTTKFGMVLAREKGLAPDGRKSTGEQVIPRRNMVGGPLGRAEPSHNQKL